MTKDKKDAIQPVEPAQPPAQVVRIRNLITAPVAMRRVALGDVKALDGWIHKMGESVEAVLWNEEEISLVLNELDLEVKFHPDIHPATAIFLTRENKHIDEGRLRVWEGEYEPVQFAKTDLLKYLKRNSALFDAEVQEAIKSLRVTEKKTQQTDLINLDDDDSYRSTEENLQDTNLPSHFHARMPLFDDFTVDLEFEAKVVPHKDKYGNETGGSKKAILVRCINVREALREAMKAVLAGLPGEIPQYYGRMHISKKD